MDSAFQVSSSVYNQPGGGPGGNNADEAEDWAESLDFMENSKGLDIGEYIIDGGYEAQDSDLMSSSASIAPLDGMAIPPSTTNSMTTV
jgi:hypothetical protein